MALDGNKPATNQTDVAVLESIRDNIEAILKMVKTGSNLPTGMIAYDAANNRLEIRAQNGTWSALDLSGSHCESS